MHQSKLHIRVGEVRVAYLQAGPESDRAIVFLHGIPTSSYLWRKVIPPLAKRWRCLAPDLLGLGDTTGEGGYSFEEQAQLLDGFLEHLGVQHAVVVGHDIGGAVAQFMACRHPRRVQSLVLCASAAYDNWPVGVIRFIQSVAKRGPALFEVFVRSGAARRLAHSRFGFAAGVKHPAALGPEAIEEYIRPILLSHSARRRFQRLLASLNNGQTWEIANEFYRFTRPVLVVWALDDPYFPLIWGERLATDFPNAKLRTIGDCGHFVPEERPRLLAKYVERFLDEDVGPPFTSPPATDEVRADEQAPPDR